MKRHTLILVVLLVLAGCAPSPAFDEEKYGSIDYDVTYCAADGVDLLMDVYYPDSGGPWPALVFIHGGGWTEGDRSWVDTGPTADGFLVVSIDYRLYPEYTFPAMIEDVKCAIRSLRAHAAAYNLDPDRIGLIGHSAGGHLAALAGLADDSAGWDGSMYRRQSSQVQAVVVLAGPADLARPMVDWANALVLEVFGTDQLASGSPVTYASPDDPPFFIVHGEADPVVPVEQAQLLHERLLAAGVSSELLIVQNAGHGLEPVGGELSPTGEEVYRRVFDFLAAYLLDAP